VNKALSLSIGGNSITNTGPNKPPQTDSHAEKLRLRAPRSFWHSVGLGPDPTRDPRLPPSGTVLKRVYGQRTIEVTVLERGFEHEGKQYGSLSLIAQRATGTRWNGYLFFGLQKEHGR
jgi:Protein of unknown function (DUF2924)